MTVSGPGNRPRCSACRTAPSAAGTCWKGTSALEVIIRETHAGLRKTYRPGIGLALIDLDQ